MSDPHLRQLTEVCRLAQNIREQFEMSKDDPLTHDPRLYVRDLDPGKEIQQDDLEEEVGMSGIIFQNVPLT